MTLSFRSVSKHLILTQYFGTSVYQGNTEAFRRRHYTRGQERLFWELENRVQSNTGGSGYLEVKSDKVSIPEKSRCIGNAPLLSFIVIGEELPDVGLYRFRCQVKKVKILSFSFLGHDFTLSSISIGRP